MDIQTQMSYLGYFNHPARCDIRIIKHPFKTVIIATERDDNPGTSITNMAEHLATLLKYALGLSINEMVWIEHYEATDDGLKLPERWALVRFEWVFKQDGVREVGSFCRPRWTHLEREEAEMLAGVKL